MRCIICGKVLPENKRKYCCTKHARLGYLSGVANPKTNTEEQVRDLFDYFKRSFDFDERKFRSESWKGRVFIEACYMLKYSSCSIARGLSKNHADILYHHKKVSLEEKELAREFLNDKKNYVYKKEIKPKSIYPEGFSY